jgi:glycopeptide antibiotics resistance protein
MIQITLWLSAAFMAVLLLIPYNVPELFQYMDKVGHIIFFSLLTYLFYLFISIRKSVLLAFSIGVMIECVHFYMESRTGSIDDIVANTIGALSMWFILNLISKKR